MYKIPVNQHKQSLKKHLVNTESSKHTNKKYLHVHIKQHIHTKAASRGHIRYRIQSIHVHVVTW